MSRLVQVGWESSRNSSRGSTKQPFSSCQSTKYYAAWSSERHLLYPVYITKIMITFLPEGESVNEFNWKVFSWGSRAMAKVMTSPKSYLSMSLSEDKSEVHFWGKGQLKRGGGHLRVSDQQRSLSFRFCVFNLIVSDKWHTFCAIFHTVCTFLVL